MKTLLMFSIVILYGELWLYGSAITARKNAPKFDEENHYEIDESFKRELSDPSYNIDFEITEVVDWPRKEVKLGQQVSGVSLDSDGNVYVFHRGDRVWNTYTFLANETLSDISQGPIMMPTVAVIHPQNGALLHEWGSNMFYLPHGITVDKDNNVWVTDVGLHQVFKFPPIFPPNRNSTALLTLGKAFTPGHNLSLFCKPTSVAVLPNGEFFVADGYCNSRIIKYSPNGTVLLNWGRSTLTQAPVTPPHYQFRIPHDLTFMENNVLCVSDRENGRIQCFYSSNGTFVTQIQLNEIGTRIFSASYTSALGGLFFIVNGQDMLNSQIHGSVVNSWNQFIKEFKPVNKTFKNPHDVIVSPNGTEIYVAELETFRIWKFKISTPHRISQNPAYGYNQGSTNIAYSKSPGTMVMAMVITAAVLCFGAALLIAALIYSRARTRGCSGQCKNPKWLVGRSTVEGFKLGNFLGQQHQGFIKLSNFEESDEDESNAGPTFA